MNFFFYRSTNDEKNRETRSEQEDERIAES